MESLEKHEHIYGWVFGLYFYIRKMQSIMSTPSPLRIIHNTNVVHVIENANLFCLKMCLQLWVKNFVIHILTSIKCLGIQLTKQNTEQQVVGNCRLWRRVSWERKEEYIVSTQYMIISESLHHIFGIIMVMWKANQTSNSLCFIIFVHVLSSPICKNPMKIILLYVIMFIGFLQLFPNFQWDVSVVWALIWAQWETVPKHYCVNKYAI